ncbi:MAG: hypothetical protein AB7M05_19360 [Alphaproteobacteria bacterium]
MRRFTPPMGWASNQHHEGLTARRAAIVAAVIIVAALATACTRSTAVSSTTPEAKKSGAATPTGFGQFNDIPIPEGSTMDMDRSLILGAQERWIGRLSLSTSQSAPATFDTFQSQMPKFGWTEVSAVRSETSVLTFSQGERVATIQIARTTFGGSTVDITMTPRGSKTTP